MKVAEGVTTLDEVLRATPAWECSRAPSRTRPPLGVNQTWPARAAA